MYKILFVCILALLTACGTQSSEPDETKFVEINLNKEFDKESIISFIDKISSIRFVPLETTDESVIDIQDIYIYKEDIFIKNRNSTSIARFSKDGKFVGKINKQGQGSDEYSLIFNFSAFEDNIYIMDRDRIQIYDLSGNYMQTIPLVSLESPNGMLISPKGEIVVSKNYFNDYYLHMFTKDGNRIASYYPPQEKLSGLNSWRHSYKAMGFYKEGIYFSQYYDCKVNYLKDNTITTLYDFHFGSANIPREFYDTPEEKFFDIFEDLKTRTVMSLSTLTLTDNWIVFSLEHWKDNSVIYYDRRTDKYVNNNNFPFPYSVLLGNDGEIKAPLGYVNGEYYRYIESIELLEILTGLREKGLLSQYDFLKGIDPKNIDEENNPFILFYTLK